MDPFRTMGKPQPAFLRLPRGRVSRISCGISSWKNRFPGQKQSRVGSDSGNGPAFFGSLRFEEFLVAANQCSLRHCFLDCTSARELQHSSRVLRDLTRSLPEERLRSSLSYESNFASTVCTFALYHKYANTRPADSTTRNRHCLFMTLKSP